MKKGFVALLILLAIVVLVSPAIVGRMAEKSMSENIEWAANQSGEVSVTTESFTRGWFSSEGQHRIEIQDGDLLLVAQSLLGPLTADDLPVLVIDTKLDHGLIPISSMSRDRGSLAPGLGSAVSTMSIELADGKVFVIPGTIYSDVGLAGELRSTLRIGEWLFRGRRYHGELGRNEYQYQNRPRTGEAAIDGNIGSFSIGDGREVLSLDQLTFKESSDRRNTA